MSDNNTSDSPLPDPWDDYRKTLLDCDRASVQEYDKAVMTLSGGTLGISFTFLQYVGKPDSLQSSDWLVWAWVSWGVSITAVLFSHYFSHLAMRQALKDLAHNNLNFERPGRHYDTLVNYLNPFAGMCFLIGVILLTVFVSKNVNYERQNAKPATERESAAATTGGRT